MGLQLRTVLRCALDRDLKVYCGQGISESSQVPQVCKVGRAGSSREAFLASITFSVSNFTTYLPYTCKLPNSVSLGNEKEHFVLPNLWLRSRPIGGVFVSAQMGLAVQPAILQHIQYHMLHYTQGLVILRYGRGMVSLLFRSKAVVSWAEV